MKKTIGKINQTLFISLIVTVIIYFILQAFYIPYIGDVMKDMLVVSTPFDIFTMSCSNLFRKVLFLSLFGIPALLWGLYKLIVIRFTKRWVTALLSGLLIIQIIAVFVAIAGAEHLKRRECEDNSIIKIEGQLND